MDAEFNEDELIVFDSDEESNDESDGDEDFDAGVTVTATMIANNKTVKKSKSKNTKR